MSHDHPVDPIDALAQQVQKLQQEVSVCRDRLTQSDQTMLQILEVLRKSESAFQVRVTKALASVFGSMAHELDHAVQSHSTPVRTMNIKVISAEEATTILHAIYVTRTGEQYDFSLASSPERIVNEGTEGIVAKMKELGLLETDGSMYIQVEVQTDIQQDYPEGAPIDGSAEQQG